MPELKFIRIESSEESPASPSPAKHNVLNIEMMQELIASSNTTGRSRAQVHIIIGGEVPAGARGGSRRHKPDQVEA